VSRNLSREIKEITGVLFYEGMKVSMVSEN
jgi:hypothetical protein